jgi:membrane-associated phospholipid phosphatase
MRKSCYAEEFPDRRIILLLTIMQIMGFTFITLVGFREEEVLTVLWGFLAVALYLYIRWAHWRGFSDSLSSAVARGLFMGAMALAILIYYEGTHETIHVLKDRTPSKRLFDDELMEIDRFLLGWIFPDGQLSLWADESRFFGPTSVFGRILTEVLQIYYLSFFGWCSILIVYIGLWEYFVCGFTGIRTEALPASDIESNDENDIRYEMHQINGETQEKEIADPVSGSWEETPRKKYRYQLWKWTFWFTHSADCWKRLLMLILATLGAFLLNYMISFMFPAVSPRVSLEDRFKHPLSGYWVSCLIRETLTKTDEGTYGSFPSGHVALTWLPAIAALKLGYSKYGWSCLVASVLITLATLYLRYHYFADVLFAIPLVIFGLYFGRIYTFEPYVQVAQRVWCWAQRISSKKTERTEHELITNSIVDGEQEEEEVEDLNANSDPHSTMRETTMDE